MTLDSRDRTLFKNDKVTQYREKINVNEPIIHTTR